MAHFNDHCNDCQRLLGARFENVNEWLDGAFRQFGPRHRFVKHHWDGVRKAEELFGADAAKAAIVHIVRDCGQVPEQKWYEDGTVDSLGIGEFAPELLVYDSLNERACEKFRQQVEAEFMKYTEHSP